MSPTVKLILEYNGFILKSTTIREFENPAYVEL